MNNIEYLSLMTIDEVVPSEFVAPDEIETRATFEYSIILESNRKVGLNFPNDSNSNMRYRDLHTGRFISPKQYETLVGKKPIA